MLSPGQYWDLDGICSRKWIKSNEMLLGLIKRGAIRVVHNSEDTVAREPIPVENSNLALPEIPVVICSPVAISFGSDSELVEEEKIDEQFELHESLQSDITADSKTEIIQILHFENNVLKIQELSVVV